ncbi:Pleckstrin homology domain-containing protein [Heracleum sosnowskyi]|uniref:Pleckstrin homology domain-containing protein n=1 Tax=Heracleum sosnowskyi TaxID=360622 RepID=A0AAD8LW43_9APIA|nr:Pleckstrin homology domain-containing protein [Heracleum sosnowskyi]
MSTDLSPQDSTLLSDVVEVGRLPCFTREDGEFRHNFYILTRQGLRYECSSVSKIQVDSWLTALHEDCKLQSDTLALKDSEEHLTIQKKHLTIQRKKNKRFELESCD